MMEMGRKICLWQEKGKPNQLITDPSTQRRRWGGNKKLRTHYGTKREKWRENIG